jgi:hypothetical protein
MRSTYPSKSHEVSQSIEEATGREWTVWYHFEQWLYRFNSSVDFTVYVLKGTLRMVLIPPSEGLKEFLVELPGVPWRRWKYQ